MTLTYKPLAVALLAVSAFGLTACNNSNQAPAPANDKKAETAPTAPAGESTLDKIKNQAKSSLLIVTHLSPFLILLTSQTSLLAMLMTYN